MVDENKEDQRRSFLHCYPLSANELKLQFLAPPPPFNIRVHPDLSNPPRPERSSAHFQASAKNIPQREHISPRGPALSSSFPASRMYLWEFCMLAPALCIVACCTMVGWLLSKIRYQTSSKILRLFVFPVSPNINSSLPKFYTLCKSHTHSEYDNSDHFNRDVA